MKKYVVLFLTAALAGIASAAIARDSYCKIGADPVNTARKLAPDERIHHTEEDLHIAMKGGSGKTYRCTLRRGEEVVIKDETGRIQWVRRCGNDVVNNIYVARDDKETAALGAGVAPFYFSGNDSGSATLLASSYDDCTGACAAQNRMALGVASAVIIGSIYSRAFAPRRTSPERPGSPGPVDPPAGPPPSEGGGPVDPPN